MSQRISLDLAQRCEKIYAERLRHHLEPEWLHYYLAIEPESGDYYLARTLSEAIESARQAHPDRLSYGMRVGHATALHMGVLSL